MEFFDQIMLGMFLSFWNCTPQESWFVAVTTSLHPINAV